MSFFSTNHLMTAFTFPQFTFTHYMIDGLATDNPVANPFCLGRFEFWIQGFLHYSKPFTFVLEPQLLQILFLAAFFLLAEQFLPEGLVVVGWM